MFRTAQVLERGRPRSPCWEVFRPLPAPGHPGFSLLCALTSLSYRSRGPGGRGCSGGRNHFSLFYPFVSIPSWGRGVGGSVWIPEWDSQDSPWCSEPLQDCPPFVKCSSQAAQALHRQPHQSSLLSGHPRHLLVQVPDVLCFPASPNLVQTLASVWNSLLFFTQQNPIHFLSNNTVSSRKPFVNAQDGQSVFL